MLFSSKCVSDLIDVMTLLRENGKEVPEYWEKAVLDACAFVMDSKFQTEDKIYPLGWELDGSISDSVKNAASLEKQIAALQGNNSEENMMKIQKLQDELSKAKQKDLKLTQTTVGPHRDDMLFSIDGIDIRKYGSQGQQRTSALSLKLSEIDLVKKIINNTPVLLLDDVLSELDSNRQNYLLENIKGIQTIITCTGLEEFVKNGININQTFEIVNGTIKDN